MSIVMNKIIGKLPIIPKKGLFFQICIIAELITRAINLRYNGNILKYIQKPTGKADEICSQHDVDYTLAKNLEDKHIADEKMINAINELPYNQQQYGTFLVKILYDQKENLD